MCDVYQLTGIFEELGTAFIRFAKFHKKCLNGLCEYQKKSPKFLFTLNIRFTEKLENKIWLKSTHLTYLCLEHNHGVTFSIWTFLFVCLWELFFTLFDVYVVQQLVIAFGILLKLKHQLLVFGGKMFAREVAAVVKSFRIMSTKIKYHVELETTFS